MPDPSASRNYLIDVGWPWTSDKAMVECSVCGLGMFVLFDQLNLGIPIHEFCLAEIKKRERDTEPVGKI